MSMRGHGMGGGRGGGWSGMRSMRQDRSVLQHRVKKGTARRMLTFAVPYRKILAIFIPVVILDAIIAAVNPLILRALIDNGILKKDKDLVIALAVLVAVLALADGALALTERRISAYIGESLIYDMRSKVFRHIQRMPLAFFTRTQTGALVSRLNNDVIGAQQAFTDLLSNVDRATWSPSSSSSSSCSSSAGRSPWWPCSSSPSSSCRRASSASASARSPRRATTSTAR